MQIPNNTQIQWTNNNNQQVDNNHDNSSIDFRSHQDDAQMYQDIQNALNSGAEEITVTTSEGNQAKISASDLKNIVETNNSDYSMLNNLLEEDHKNFISTDDITNIVANNLNAETPYKVRSIVFNLEKQQDEAINNLFS